MIDWSKLVDYFKLVGLGDVLNDLDLSLVVSNDEIVISSVLKEEGLHAGFVLSPFLLVSSAFEHENISENSMYL